MEVSAIIAEIDAEILKLTQARNILLNVATQTTAVKAGRGRPKGNRNVETPVLAALSNPKRKLSPEGRKRIADAMKRRWAERRKTVAKPAAKTAAK